MSDEKDPVRVGRFEWERLMLMSVPHPTNFKLLPLGVFMSADGGKARPGNTSLAMFGPHEKTWAKLLRWAVAEGWLLQVSRGGARRGPNGTTVVRASVYAASVPQAVWERRMEILGAPPFRASGVEGSASDPLKGAPDGSLETPDSLKGASGAPFNAPDASLKGALRGSLPDSLKGAPEGFEGSDPSFEGSVSGFEGSAQTLPHHVVLSSRSDSSSTSSTTPVAEAVEDGFVDDSDGTEEGGGDISESRSIAEQIVAALDYRGQTPNRKQQETLTGRLVAALDAGWTIDALADHLRLKGAIESAYALYAYRLRPDILPDPPQPPVAQQATTHLTPPVCDTCMRNNPAARTNMRFRFRVIDGENQACPDCHPSAAPVTSGSFADLADGLYNPNPFAGDTADGGLWERAAARAAARSQPLSGTDAKVQGWLDLSRQLAAEEELSTADQRVIQGQVLAAKFRAAEATTDGRVRQALEAGQRVQRQQAPRTGRHYTNDVWHQPADPGEAAKIPHCGDPGCDPVTRLKTGPDWTGAIHTSVCGTCHPAMKI